MWRTPAAAASRIRSSLFASLLATLFIILILSPSAHALALRRATVRTQVLALDASSVDTTSSPPSPQSITAAKLAVITLRFDEPLFVSSRTNCTSSSARISLDSVTSVADLFGLTRLICGRTLLESHPIDAKSFSLKQPQLLPPFMLTTPARGGNWSEEFPLLSLLDDELFTESMDELEEEAPSGNGEFLSYAQQQQQEAIRARTLHAFLVLASADASGRWSHRISAPLDSCEVRVLDQTSQSWLPTAALTGANTLTPLVARKRIEYIRASPYMLEDQPLFPTTSVPASAVRALLRSGLKKEVKKSGNFLETQTASAATAMLTSSEKTEVKFGGLIKGILTGLLTALTDPMGNMIGDFTGDGILDPVAEKVLDGVSDAMQVGMAPYLVSDIVVQVTPGVCEAVAASLTESTATAISEQVVRGTTETITTDVTTRVTHTIVDPATLRSSQFIAVKLARMLHNSLVHILSRSIPHIVVPSLLNTVSVGLKEMYYCYFCTEKQIYCQYCHKNRGDTASRLYYGLYYTGYHTTYYSNWYANQRKFGVLMMQKRQLNPLDEVDDEDEKAWDIVGRTEQDGTQKDAEDEAKVVTKEEYDEAAGGGDGGDGGE